MVFSPVVGVAALGGVMFLRMLGVFVTLPVVAIYADALQAHPSATLTGFALGAYGVTQAAAQIGFGRFADRRGRKPALLAALALFVAGALWAAAAGSVAELIAARLLQGAGAAAAAIMAWLADITPPQMRGRAMAVVGVGVGAAFALSLLIAAPIAGAFGAAGVFDAAALLGAAAFVAVLFLPAPPKDAPDPVIPAPSSVIPAQAGIHSDPAEVRDSGVQANPIDTMDSRLRGNDGDGRGNDGGWARE